MSTSEDPIEEPDGFTPLPKRPRRPGRGSTGTEANEEQSEPSSSQRTTEKAAPTGVAKRNNGLRVAGSPMSPVSPLLDAISEDLTETFHYLLARVQLEGGEPLPAKIGIVAATHGEGVTTVSRAFAAILANDFDTSVCLIDLSSPQQEARRQNDGGQRGLFDLLSGNATLDEAVVSTVDDRLWVMNAGGCSISEARNLYRAAGLKDVVDELQQRYTYLVFDVPPLLVGSEGLVLLRHTDGYILVVRHGSTPIDQVRAATAEIGSIRSIGVVLNRVSTKIPKRLQRFFKP